MVKKEARVGELEAEVGRIERALETRISGPLQWKSQQEQETRERAVELERLKGTIEKLQADAIERTRAEAAALQAERSARDSLTEIAQGIKEALQNFDQRNKQMVKGFKDSTKDVGGLAGRLGLESLYLLVFLWFLNKAWDWSSAYQN